MPDRSTGIRSILTNFLFALLVGSGAISSAADAPLALTATIISSNEVQLSWKANRGTPAVFNIERRTGDGEFESLTTLPNNATDFRDHALTGGVTYTYRISTTTARGITGAVETRISLIPPPEPRGMLASSPSGKKVVLNWTDRSDNEDGFVIERKTNAPQSTFVEIVRGVKAATYTDTTVTPGAVYTYHVRAYNALGTSTFAEVMVKAGARPPDPKITRIPVWNVPAKVIYTKAFPGFMDIEIYQENGRYFVRDKIKNADYSDPRPRRAYYVDMENVGPSLEKGYPLPERGGIYQVQCKRWREGKDQWDLQDADVAMEWVIKPGPLGVAGELFIPPTFAFNTEDWRDQQVKAIPPFKPILGKASPSYRYNADQTWEEVLSRGVSHTASGVGPGGSENMLLTMGDPLDALGEQGFAALSKQELTDWAAKIPPLAFYFTDWEKQAGWHNTPTYWSIDLPDETVLRNYYYYFSELNRMYPARKNGDYYRALQWHNSFYDEGEAYPLRQRFIEQTEDPEKYTGPAFRNFTYFDGE